MNPRKKSGPLTWIDRQIMDRIRIRWHYPLNHWYQYYDGLDADLMFEAQRDRSYTFPVDLPPLQVDGIDCGGALWEWRTLNITYFA